ncbi:MAG: hypothetical protein H0X25_15930 [Acidobacteriales bacterium]|nr:hypothetical protein [Terriglobales bacterium]
MVRQRIQIFLVLGLMVAGLRLAYVFYERHQDEQAAAAAGKRPAANYVLNRDFYVTPKRLHPHDVASAHQLTRQPVWVKEGYRYSYYPYDESRKRTNFAQEAGQLGPLQKLQIKDVVTSPTPGDASSKQVMATFAENGRSYAVPIGISRGGDTSIYSDEIFYIEDPQQLYGHWPAEVWSAIEQHDVKPGMNELQTDFAIGFGIPEDAHVSSTRTVHYANGGKPVTVVFRDGVAVQVKRG